MSITQLTTSATNEIEGYYLKVTYLGFRKRKSESNGFSGKSKDECRAKCKEWILKDRPKILNAQWGKCFFKSYENDPVASKWGDMNFVEPFQKWEDFSEDALKILNLKL